MKLYIRNIGLYSFIFRNSEPQKDSMSHTPHEQETNLGFGDPSSVSYKTNIAYEKIDRLCWFIELVY